IQRHVYETGVTVVALAIGEGQLGGLDVDVQELGGVVPESAQIETFEQLQVLEKDRALRPWAALEHFDAAVGRARRVLDARATGAVVGKVLELQQAGMR